MDGAAEAPSGIDSELRNQSTTHQNPQTAAGVRPYDQSEGGSVGPMDGAAGAPSGIDSELRTKLPPRRDFGSRGRFHGLVLAPWWTSAPFRCDAGNPGRRSAASRTTRSHQPFKTDNCLFDLLSLFS